MLPLLQKSSDPKIINISSGRASLARNGAGLLPPTASVSYSVSKAALNALTIQMAMAYPNIGVQAANPGHCRTAFNGFRGTKDPRDGAKVVLELVKAEKGKWKNGGFWELEPGQEGVTAVSW